MQCISDSLLLLANIICAQDRFFLISHFSSKSALLAHPFILQSNLLTYLSGSPRFPAPFVPFLSFSWQADGVRIKEAVHSKIKTTSVTCRAVYPSRFSQFELQHFTDICLPVSFSHCQSLYSVMTEMNEWKHLFCFVFLNISPSQQPASCSERWSELIRCWPTHSWEAKWWISFWVLCMQCHPVTSLASGMGSNYWSNSEDATKIWSGPFNIKQRVVYVWCLFVLRAIE